MAARGGKNRKKLIRLWLQNPHCYYCKKKTVLISVAPGERIPKDMCNYPLRATLEHLRSRLHPGRLEPPEPGEPRIVLACHQCNHQRGAEEVAALGLEEIWARCGQYPQDHEKAKNKKHNRCYDVVCEKTNGEKED